MRSRARFAGHAVHPMLIVLPLGLFVTAVVFDALYLITGSGNFVVSGAYTTAAGVVGGLLLAGRLRRSRPRTANRTAKAGVSMCEFLS